MEQHPQPPTPASAPGPQKPGMVTAMTVMILVNGILNILAAVGLTFSIILGTIGIGIICAPLTILPAALGVFEIIYASRLLSDPPKLTELPIVIPILEIVCILYLNVISLVVGILNLVFLNDPAVKDYFNRLKASSAP